MRYIWWKAFRFSSTTHNPGLAAFLFFHSLKCEVKRNDGGSKIRILILSKESFKEDALASFGEVKCFEIYSLDVVRNKAFKAMASTFLPGQVGDNNYLSDELSIVQGKEGYRSFLRQFWLKLKKYIKIDAVLTANFAYYAERELAATLEELGVPFIVLHKENLKSPGREAFFRGLYEKRRGPFFGRRILVYNEIERRIQIEAGIVEPNRITVTGMPRLDRIHHWRMKRCRQAKKSSEEERQVLFFSFGPKTGLPMIPRKTWSGFSGGYERLPAEMEALSWKVLVKESHRAIVRFARENPELRVIIKAKGRRMESEVLNDMFDEIPDLPTNLKIMVGGDPVELIARSSAVCGFNTTALIEAIAAGKAVIVPWFAEAKDDKMQPYIVDLGEAVEYSDTPDNLVTRLRYYVDHPKPVTAELSPDVSFILEKWVGNPDGLAGQRVREALLRELNV